MIYFIGSKTEKKVKIGYTFSQIRTRFHTIQANCPFIVELLANIDGLKNTEKYIHNLFKKDLIRGEWFTLSDELEAFIANPCVPDTIIETWKPTPRKDSYKDKNDVELEKMYSEGVSVKNIAKSLNYTYSQVRTYISRRELHRLYPKCRSKKGNRTGKPRTKKILFI